MRRVSLKRTKHNRAVQPLRDAYRAEFPKCQVPWCRAAATELHELARGAGRKAALGVRAAWLHLCAFDHRQMDVLPVAGQLALKKLSDPKGYSRRRVNELRGRQPDAITAREVRVWTKRFENSETSPMKTVAGSGKLWK